MFRFLLICFLVIPLLIACSSPKDNRITIWAHFDPPEKILIQKQIDQFATEYPDWEFNLVTFSKQDIKSLYPISVIGKSGPSILYGFSSDIGQLAELNVLEPLEPLIDSTFLKSFSSFPINPLIKQKSQVTGKTHIFQIADQIVNQQFLLYNKDLISLSTDSSGTLSIVHNQPPIEPNVNKDFPFPYDFVWDFENPSLYYCFLSGFGGLLVDGYDMPVLDSPEAQNGLKAFSDFVTGGIRIPVDGNLEQSRTWFRQRKAALIIDGLYQANEFVKVGIPVGYVSLSSLVKPNQHARPLIFMKGFSINPEQSEVKKKLAAKLIMFLCNRKNQVERTLVSFNLPVSNDALKDSLIQNSPVFHLMINETRNGGEIPLSPESTLILKELSTGYRQFLEDKTISPEQSANKMQESALQLIKNIRK